MKFVGKSCSTNNATFNRIHQISFRIRIAGAALKNSKENQTRDKVWAIYVGKKGCVKVKVFWEDWEFICPE